MFENELNALIDTMFPLDWDRKSYKFNREEKDMHPYSIKNEKEKSIITHNILGINKEDLQITKECENGIVSLIIKGKTKDSITGKEYSINSRFNLDENQLDLTKIQATTKNGLLYIIIPTKENTPKLEKKTIEIK